MIEVLLISSEIGKNYELVPITHYHWNLNRLATQDFVKEPLTLWNLPMADTYKTMSKCLLFTSLRHTEVSSKNQN